MTSSWMVCAQGLTNDIDSLKPKIDLIVVNGDTSFVINRKFAEKIAIQYDSLKIVTAKLSEYKIVLDDCVKVKDQYKVALDKSMDITDMLKREAETKDQIVKGYKTIEESQKKIITDLNTEFRKVKNRNKWLTGLSIGGVTFGFTSFILLLLK